MDKQYILQFSKKACWLKYVKTLILLPLTFIFLTQNLAYSSNTEVPDWVKSRPINSFYYIGIGISQKGQSDDYILKAKNDALNDLASEISIVISSNSVLQQFENNDEVKLKFESLIKSTTEEDLEEYEMVGSWENEKEYWVYYKLSKETYKNIKKSKLEQAKALSLDYFTKAQKLESEYDINNAIVFYLKSLDALKKYLEEDLSIFTDNGQIYLSNEILKSTIQLFTNIRLSAENPQLNGKVLNPVNAPIIINTIYISDNKSIPISNLPLNFYFNKGKGVLSDKVKTDEAGKAFCKISTIGSREKHQEIIATIDINNYFEETDENNLILYMVFKKSIVPTVKINLSVTPLIAFLESDELILNQASKKQVLTRFLKTYTSENFFIFTDKKEDAELLISVKSNISKGSLIKGEMYNMYELYLNYNISIQNTKTGLEVFNEGFTNLKSLASENSNFENNANTLTKMALKKIQKNIIPQLEKMNF